MPTTTTIASPATRTASAAAELAGSAADRLVLIVAPCNGRFRPLVDAGPVTAGQVVAHVTGARGRADEVTAPVTGRIQGLLTMAGHLVTRGQALAWAHVEEPHAA